MTSSAAMSLPSPVTFLQEFHKDSRAAAAIARRNFSLCGQSDGVFCHESTVTRTFHSDPNKSQVKDLDRAISTNSTLGLTETAIRSRDLAAPLNQNDVIRLRLTAQQSGRTPSN
jgi:hypothetical protein